MPITNKDLQELTERLRKSGYTPSKTNNQAHAKSNKTTLHQLAVELRKTGIY